MTTMKGWSLLRIGLTGLRRDLKIARIARIVPVTF